MKHDTTERFTLAMPVAFSALMILVGCGGKSETEGDADSPEDLADPGEEPGLDALDIPESEADDGGDFDEENQADASDAAEAGEDVVEEPAGPCGNGIVEAELGEKCDDGNRETEFCGRREDCLGDCSLQIGSCGDRVFDPEAGEQCDGSAPENTLECTSSCNINDHGIGAPCRCISNCDEPAFWLRTSEGCESVPTEGTGGESVCIETMTFPPFGSIYGAEGYCTLMALRCEGDPTTCDIISPEPGDIDALSCPGGSYERMLVAVAFGATFTIKLCSKICTSDSECRWNAWDEEEGECGMERCFQVPEEPETSICVDERNLPLFEGS
jgi:hypothetical protein